jgi:hypothetical protein
MRGLVREGGRSEDMLCHYARSWLAGWLGCCTLHGGSGNDGFVRFGLHGVRVAVAVKLSLVARLCAVVTLFLIAGV